MSYILSGDRDLLQLIDDKVTVLLATTSDTRVMHREEFIEEYEIAPEQFVDMKPVISGSGGLLLFGPISTDPIISSGNSGPNKS